MACDTRAPSAAPKPAPATATTATGVRAALKDAPLGHVTSRDASGAARFLVGALVDAPPVLAVSHEAAARAHLARHAALLGIGEDVVAQASLVRAHALEGGGAVVQLGQKVGGVEVFRARAHVVLDAKKQLVSAATTLHPAAAPGARAPTFTRTRETAIANALAAQYGTTPVRVGHASSTQVLFPIGTRLVPAHYVEVLTRLPGSRENEAWSYVIADDDARVLYQASLLEHLAYTYRVWADPSGNHIPTDGPMQDYTPHPTGLPDHSVPGFAQPILVTMEGFNTNPQHQADPWLSPTATVTNGNNVHAYTDRDQNGTVGDGFDVNDVEADLTSAATFDRTYDTAAQPNVTIDQEKAAVAQIFYTTNWLHDYWYGSGFDEASGVAQLSNYGRGGIEGDPLRAEAQDSADHGAMNNANMASFTDGTSPRMQMYVWSGAAARSITTSPATSYPDGYGIASGIGPQVFDVTGTLVRADNLTACTPPGNVSGKIAVVDRGGCPFVTKVQSAQAGGALGVIIVNSIPGHVALGMAGVAPTTIGVLSVSYEDGQQLEAAIANGTVTGEMKRGAEVLRDGTIDNSVVAHEWGHYLHHRLVLCGSVSCRGMSEGWADFDALMMVIKDGDTLTGPAFPLAQYAAGGLSNNSAYFGIRRAPYSTDFAKFPFTFGHVRHAATLPTGAPLAAASPDMAEVHNVGEIWAEALFEGYVGMQSAGRAASRSFDQVKRNLANVIVAGMKATPTEPTFVEQRDAILATAWSFGRKDEFTALAKGFAKRGFGIGAIAPPTSSLTLNEAVENFDFKGNLAFVDMKLDDSVVSCDNDGVLDSGESGKLTIRVKNAGWLALTHTGLFAQTIPEIVLENGGQTFVQSIDPYGVATIAVGARMKEGISAKSIPHVGVTLSDVDSYVPSISNSVPLLVNADEAPGTSATDDVESKTPLWTLMHGTTTHTTWLRQGDAANHYWHGIDNAVPSDESLASPSLNVSATANFTIAFKHRYQFEHDTTNFYDGGVLEISDDNGTTWKDVSTYVNPGYPQTLFSQTPNTNVLAGKKAWGGDSAGYPAFVDVALDLGTQLAGKTVKVRFRIGTDDGGTASGWDIDDIAFGGITNKPFATIVDNGTVCASDGGVVNPGGGGDDSGAHDSGVDSSSTGGGGDDSGVPQGHDAAPELPEETDGSLGGGCATSPSAPASGAGGVLVALAALFARRRRAR